MDLGHNPALTVGAQVELVDPYVTEEDPVAAAVAAVRAFEPHVVGLGIRVVEERLRRRAITVRELSTEG